MGKLVYVREKKTKAHEPGIWPEKKKIEAVTMYLAVGKLPLVAAATGIPYKTLRTWAYRDAWWKEKIKELQKEETLELDAKLRKIVEKSLDKVEDILENGEYYYDPRTGKTKRVPPKLRDVHRVMGDTIDKRRLLRQDPEKETKQQITADHLVALAQEFAKMATGQATKRIESVVEGDVVYEQLGLGETTDDDDDHNFDKDIETDGN